MIVYDITVKHIEIRKEPEQKYGIELEWEITHSGNAVCQGPFFLLLYQGNVFLKAFPIMLNEGSVHTGSVHGFASFPTESAAVKVGLSEQSKDARGYLPVPLVTEAYQELQAIYRKNGLWVSWNGQASSGLSGIAILQRDGQDYGKQFPIPEGDSNVVLPISLKQEDISILFLKKKDLKGNVQSLGVASEIQAPGIAPVFSSVDVQGNEITVNYKMRGETAVSQDKFCFWAELSCKENVIYKSEEFKPETQGELLQYHFVVPQELCWDPELCQLSLYYRMEHFCYQDQNKDNCIPLAIPAPQISIEQNGESLLQWKDAQEADDFLITVSSEETKHTDKTQQTFGQRDILFLPTEAEGKAATVAALYGPSKIRGPFSSSVPLIPKGLYADSQMPGLLRYQRMRSGRVSFPTLGPLFQSVISDTIAGAPFCIQPRDEGYTVIIDYGGDFSYDNLTHWLKQLFEKGLSPFGYYCIRNLVARLSPLDADHMFLFYCGAQKNGLSLELIPGFRLCVENEYYIHQEANTKEENGFVGGAAREYVISLQGRSRNAVLEMNSLFSHVAGSWTDGGWRSYPYPASGMMDFFLAPLRSAYYRLCYPKSFLTGEHPGNTYPGDNICLMALSPWDPVPDQLEETNFPGIVMRGRTSITVNLEVFVNRTPVSVPAGTTLAGLLSRYAANPLEIRMYRRSGWPYGKFLPVYLGTAAKDWDFLNALVLLAGDRIEV